MCASLFFFNDTATTEIYTLSLHDALPISLRSQTPNGVIQELYALLLAHTLLRTLMLRAAQPQGLAPSRISFTDTVRLVDDSLIPLSLVTASRRQQRVSSLLQEMGTFRLPH